MSGVGISGLLLIALALTACGGGGGSSSSSTVTGGAEIEDTPLGDTSIDLTEEDLAEIDGSMGETVGTLLDCSDNTDGGVKGCWKNSACTGGLVEDRDYFVSSRAEFKSDGAQNIIDFAGYFYDNAACGGTPLFVYRIDKLRVTYTENDMEFDSSGQKVTPFDFRVATDGVRNFDGKASYIIRPGDILCLSDSMAMTADGVAIKNEEDIDITAFENCYERTSSM